MVTRRLFGTLFSFGTFGTVLLGCNAIWGIEEPNPTIVGVDGGGIVTPADGSTTADQSLPGTDGSGGPCDIAKQTGCRPNETCAPTDTKGKSSRCVPAGANGPGFGCESEANCGPGHICWFGACHKPCFHSEATPECTETNTGCLPIDPEAQYGAPNVGVCLIACVPGDPVGCGGIPTNGPLASCRIIFSDVTTCTLASRTGATTDCALDSRTVDKACQRDYSCIGSTSSRCVPYCRVAAGCATGACQGFPAGNELYLDGEEWGICP